MANPEGKGGFQPGVSGNPGGRAAYRLLTDAFRRELTPEVATAIARNALAICQTDRRMLPQLLSLVWDRLEGPVQRDLNLNVGQQSSVVLIPSNKREKPLQLTTDGEVLEAEYQVWEVQGNPEAELMKDVEPSSEDLTGKEPSDNETT